MIVFQIHLRPREAGDDGLRERVEGEFLPAVRAQPGCRGAVLLRAYVEQPGQPPDRLDGTYPCQIELRFDSENARLAWVASDAHQRVWPRIRELVAEARPVGYHVAAGQV